MNRDLGCINPHGVYPFPASRDVCPDCQAIRTHEAERLKNPFFTGSRGLRYRWWRDIRWDIVVSCITVLVFAFMMAYVIVAWYLDLKWSDLPW